MAPRPADRALAAFAPERDIAQPIHEQIAEHFRQMIATGMWPRAYRLPSEVDLAESFAVARGTARKAIRALVDQGLLVQVQGRGTFVVAHPSPDDTPNYFGPLDSNGAELVAEGIDFSTELLSRSIVAESDDTGPFSGGPILQLRRLRSLTGGPDAVIDNDISLAELPGAEAIDAEMVAAEPLHSILRRRFGATFDRAERVFSADIASDEIAALLRLPSGAPTLRFEQFSYGADGECIEYSHAWMRTDRRRLRMTIKENR